MNLFSTLVKPLCLCKAKKIGKHCGPYVNGRVLDVGSGRCLIAKELQENYNVRMTCIDVDDLNETSLPLIVYDGKKIPFGGGRFDTVLLVYVLHHCEDPVAVLKECRRVCKNGGKIIIFEDFGFIWLTYFMDIVANRLHNVATPLNFRSRKEWEKTFRRLGFSLIYSEDGVEKQVFYPFVEHTMFVLRVRK
ncbi:MAG: class I SAM-dependent methyltransferase [Candidatus Aenigmarchaeota archaeon]|nr:class I SAM-dependent methyltransferase [Candidatus Aenigmarchaeota archaeon]